MPNMHDYAAISNLSGLANSLGSFNAAAALASNMNNLAADPMQLGAAQVGMVGDGCWAQCSAAGCCVWSAHQGEAHGLNICRALAWAGFLCPEHM